MSPCDIVGISDRLADHDSLSIQRFFQGKQLSRVVTLVLDHAIAAIQTLKAYNNGFSYNKCNNNMWNGTSETDVIYFTSATRKCI